MKNYKNIPTEDWLKYPEAKPKKSGYYLTTYLNKTINEEPNLFYKCIYWSDEKQDWISWRSPFSSIPHLFEVGCFVDKTRSDFYSNCLSKLNELYCITTC